MIYRVLIAFFLVLFVSFYFHTSVASDGKNRPPMVQLIELPPLSDLNLQCAKLAEQSNLILEKILEDSSIYESFFGKVGEVYSQWSDILSPREEQAWVWLNGEFDGLVDLSVISEESSNRIFERTTKVEKRLLALLATIKSCVTSGVSVEQSVAKPLFEEYENFIYSHSEFQNTVADYLSQMSLMLSDAATKWKQLEGTETLVPEGYFGQLGNDSRSFHEAAFLVVDSQAALNEKHADMLTKLLALAPVLQSP